MWSKKELKRAWRLIDKPKTGQVLSQIKIRTGWLGQCSEKRSFNSFGKTPTVSTWKRITIKWDILKCIDLSKEYYFYKKSQSKPLTEVPKRWKICWYPKPLPVQLTMKLRWIVNFYFIGNYLTLQKNNVWKVKQFL